MNNKFTYNGGNIVFFPYHCIAFLKIVNRDSILIREEKEENV